MRVISPRLPYDARSPNDTVKWPMRLLHDALFVAFYESNSASSLSLSAAISAALSASLSATLVRRISYCPDLEAD